MTPLVHTVGKQTLAITCAGMEDALALRAQVADWNRLHLLPVIERVFSEVNIEGQHIRIDRLAVDLGDIPVSDFEEIAPARLYQELKEAVLRAMASPFESRSQPAQLARIELLEFYLLRGSLPFHTVAAASFSLEELFAELAVEDPDALARLVRKTATSEYVLRRIVYQLSDAELRRLIAVLDPEHAALILAYMVDLDAIQREQAIAAVDENEFDRLVWFLVLSYLVYEAGSQFNRKVFVQSIIAGFAEQQNLDYEQMLALFGQALERTLARRSIPSSLPAVIGELVQEASSDTPRKMEAAEGARLDKAALAALLSELEPALAQSIFSLLAGSPIFREMESAELVRPDEAALVALFSEREPAQARSILSLPPSSPFSTAIAELLQAANSTLQREMEPAELARLVRTRGSNSAWLDETMPVALLSELEPAQAQSILSLLASSQTFKEINPAELARLVRARGASSAWLDETTLVALLSELEPVQAQSILSLLPSSPFSTAIAELIQAVNSALQPETLPDHGSPAFSEMEPADLARLVRARGPSSAWLRALIQALDEAALVALLGELEPVQAQSILSFLLDLRDVHQAQPDDSGEPAQFDRLLWFLTLTWAVERSGSEFNRKMFLLSLLHGLARNEGLNFAAVTATFRLGLAKAALRAPLRSSLPAILAAVVSDLDRAGLAGSDSDRAGVINPAGASGFEDILSYAAGANRKALRSLLEAIESLSGADRPDEKKLRAVLLEEILRWNPDREMDRSFFERIFRSSFPQPLPERVRNSLLSAAPDTVPELRAALLTPAPAQLDNRSPEAIIAALLNRSSDSALAGDALILQLEAALAENTGLEAIRQQLQDRRVRDCLIRILPRSTWKTLVRALEPGRYHALEEAEPILAAAWALARPGSRSSEIRQVIRMAMLEAIAEGACSVTAVTARVLRYIQNAEPRDPEVEVRFRQHIGRLAESRGISSLRSSTLPNSLLPPAPRKAAAPPIPPPEASGDAIYVANAGIVLASPFLPHLFGTLGMLENDEKGHARWGRPQDAMRAVHLLQYLVDERTSAPEPQLALNKILCGLPTAAPVEREVELTAREIEICDQLLHAMIANWPVLANSSPAALRETFFQREGRLMREDAAWKLRVQRRTLDVLVDQVPWSYKTIFHDWMLETVHVAW